MSLPLVTRFGADPLLDLEVANKRYVDNSGPAITTTNVSLSSDFSTTSTSFIDVTGLTMTLQASGSFLSVFSASMFVTVGSGDPTTRQIQAATQRAVNHISGLSVGNAYGTATNFAGTSGSEILKIQMKVDAGTGSIGGLTDFRVSQLSVIEFS